MAGPLRLRLNPTLTPAAWRPVFRSHRRLHVPDFLEPLAAAALHARLSAARDWTRTIHLAAGRDVDVRPDELEAMSAEERARLERELVDSSTDSVKYVFDKIRTPSAVELAPATAETMETLTAFVNGRAFLDFVRRLTGDARPASADVMATRYLEGHFATAHQDELANARRLYAYVLNLTPEWRADWGGVLTFLDEDGHVAEGYVPRFNALNVFAVPQTHLVSAVSRLARAPRLSVTGWLHAPG